MSLPGKNVISTIQPVLGLVSVTPSSSTPTRISLKNARSAGVLVIVKNATTVTGSAITLKQSSDVSGTGEKALAFTTYYSINDTATADAPWVKQTAASNTFTTDNTNSKNSLYFIPIDPGTLDAANAFDCVRAGTGDATATTLTVVYLLEPTYNGNPVTVPSFIID
jgi:hypothetical protein